MSNNPYSLLMVVRSLSDTEVYTGPNMNPVSHIFSENHQALMEGMKKGLIAFPVMSPVYTSKHR